MVQVVDRADFDKPLIRRKVLTAKNARGLATVVEEAEARCPVFNLIKDANVRTDIVWIRDSSV